MSCFLRTPSSVPSDRTGRPGGGRFRFKRVAGCPVAKGHRDQNGHAGHVIDAGLFRIFLPRSLLPFAGMPTHGWNLHGPIFTLLHCNSLTFGEKLL